jgi:outer membrane lipoprotein-sorting protein
MNEVLRFSTDSRGTITVIGKDGKIVRYQITDVAKVTIQ